MGRSDTRKRCSIFILLPSLLPLLKVKAFLLTLVSGLIRPCEKIIPPKVSQESTTILQVKVHNVYVIQNSWRLTLASVSYKFG